MRGSLNKSPRGSEISPHLTARVSDAGEATAEEAIDLDVWLAILIVALVAAVATALLIVVRVRNLRGSGTAVLLRTIGDLGAVEGSTWRHGVVRYREDDLRFYQLSSLRLGPSRLVLRTTLEVVGARSSRPGERDVLAEAADVLAIVDADRIIEIAFDRDGHTAFTAWVEARPDPRTSGALRRARRAPRK